MFVDRVRELQKIASLLEQPRSLNLVYGKRRVGKTRLLQQALRRKSHVYFLAKMASSEENLRDLLRDFQQQAPRSTFASIEKIESWPVFFGLLQNEIRRTRNSILVLDEFQYLVEAEPLLPSLIQRFWDQLDEEARIHLFLCGSSLGMLSQLGEAHQPLYGRFTWQHELSPFDYLDAALFVSKWSSADRMRAYGAFGGLARHLEFIDPNSDIDEEVVNHILDPLGGLHQALDQMLQMERIRDTAPYRGVLAAIVHGNTRPGEIQSFTGLTTGSVNNALKGLQQLKMVKRWVPFGEKPSTTRSIYRLSDPFLVFYFRFVDPYRSMLTKGDPAQIYRRWIKPHLDTHMGLIFERICHEYLHRFGSQLFDEPLRGLTCYWSRDGAIEIDIMARLARRGILVGECKWREERPIGMDVLGDLRRKIALAGHREWQHNARYLIACSTGFTDELRSATNVTLIDPEQLLP